MLLTINYISYIYMIIFLFSFVLSYFIILGSRLESLFKQGNTWQIRLAQIFMALIIAYLVSQSLISLINSFQIV